MNRAQVYFLPIIFCLLLHQLSAQEYRQHEVGTPFIRNYPPREYKAFSQNWQIVQDSRGVMYIANGDGVLEYDGVTWRLIKIKGNYTVGALAIDEEGIIYVGSINEMGYLAPDNKGKMQYFSLTDSIAKNKIEMGFITQIHIISKNELIVVSNTTTFKLKFVDNNYRIKVFSNINNFFKIDDSFYTWNSKSGICILSNDSIIPIKGTEFFKDKGVQTILEYDNNNILVLTRKDGFFIVSKYQKAKEAKITYFPTQIDEFLNKNRYNNALKLQDGSFAFATSRAGTVIMDNKGLIIQLLNKSIGIYNDTHYYLFQDSEEALWFAMDNGISKAETNSPISFWNDATGLKGSVLSITRFNDVLYAGTWQGLFYLDLKGNNKILQKSNLDILVFKPVKGITTTCWDLLNLSMSNRPSALLAATTEGVFSIEKDTAYLVYEENTNKMHHISTMTDLVLLGLENGAAILKVDTSDKKRIKFIKPEKINNINDRIISIGETSTGELWMGTQYNGVIHLEKNQQKTDSVSKKFNPVQYTKFKNTSLGGSIYINKYGKDLIFSCDNGLYYFAQDNTIKPFNSFFNSILSNWGIITVFKEDYKGNLWIQLTQKEDGDKILFCIENINKNRGINTVPFRPIPKAEIWCFYPEKNGIIWLCSDEGLYRYNPDIYYYYQKDFNTLIRKITLENDTILYGGCDSVLKRPFNITFEDDDEKTLSFNKNSIKYANNSLIIEFASLFFYDEAQNNYKYKLEGFDKKWSEWTTETKKEYTNLPPGKYTFRVYSKNIFEKQGNEAVYTFEILPPWYRTFWAYFMFLLLAGGFVYLIIKYSSKKLIEAKIRLENMVQERTSEINQQKRELEKEKEKSDRLLLNILPFKIAEELKEKGVAKAKYYEKVTVMFADFTGFTQIAEQIEPEELIKELNNCFVFFDEVCVRHNIEKIKTVGDSYMCAGGIPIKNNTNPIDIILAAFEMINFIKKLQQEQLKKGNTLWHIRIGIHTGEIIAGVVGKKKFAYDIWGDTVNTASRLETTSEPDKINISGATYHMVKEFFVCEYRGKVAAKHKGEVDMNFVYRIKPELSHDDDGFIPNIQFKEMYNKLLKE